MNEECGFSRKPVETDAEAARVVEWAARAAREHDLHGVASELNFAHAYLTRTPASCSPDVVALRERLLAKAASLEADDDDALMLADELAGELRQAADALESMMRRVDAMEVNWEELAIQHGQQVTVTFKDKADAFALFNELKARAALSDGIEQKSDAD